jgi:hypothetical protein
LKHAILVIQSKENYLLQLVSLAVDEKVEKE